MYVIAIADCLIYVFMRVARLDVRVWLRETTSWARLAAFLPFADVNSLSARAREREL